MSKEFVNLHNHTCQGSMLDSMNDVNKLFDKVSELGQKAIAITDHGTLAAYYDSYYASKRTGVKFIPGCEAYYVNSYNIDESEDLKKERRKHILLLAQNEIGYKNLLKLNYIGFQNHDVSMGRVFPKIDWNILSKHADGLIVTSACGQSPIARLIMEDNYEGALKTAVKFAELFDGRFYLEIHPHNLKVEGLDQHYINLQLIKISKELGLPLVTTSDVHYLTKEMAKYHDVLLAINSKKPVDDPTRHRYGIDEFYVKTGDEIYDYLHNLYGKNVAEEAIGNTVKISEMCENPDYMDMDSNHLPSFPVKDEKDYNLFLEWKEKTKLSNKINEDAAYMRYKCVNSFKKKFPDVQKEEFIDMWNRVKYELKVLEGNNFSSYMLIVSDFIKWAKENNILVGTGRGSVCGSFVAYLLEIHDVNPIQYDIIFERFQNAEKKSLPDIDTDFTSAGRDLVKNYVINKYGHDCCAQVSNINKYTPKNVVPDLVKSMRNVMPNLIPKDVNYVKVSEMIKNIIPDDISIRTIEDALEESADFRRFAQNNPEFMEYAKAIVGMPKEYSNHAAGLIISDKPIVDFAPLRVGKDGAVSVQYEKNRCESIGLVKMDFLSLETLDIIDETFKNIKKLGDGPTKIEQIPLDDRKAYEMLHKGFTKCVFQLGKAGIMPTLCKAVKPNSILDIAIINALGRPSCKLERNEYVQRRFNSKKVEYLHPSLESALRETYGLCIIEDQLMSVAKEVAGWDLNKADGLRKLTKLKEKGHDLALKLEIDFIEGAMKKHSMEYELAKKIWDEVVVKFNQYGFNKSHAIAYSINGYITAYLKCHHPTAFLCAFLKLKTQGGGVSKDEEIDFAKSECRRLGIKILPPDVNRSSSGYEILDNKTIVMGLEAIKGLGEKAVDEIIKNQPYENFITFIYKTEARVVNKSKLEALAKAGCFDSMNLKRKDVFENGKSARDRLANALKKNQNTDQVLENFSLNFNNIEWNKQELLRHEQECLGELLSGDINELYNGFFDLINTTPFSRLKMLPDKSAILVEGIIKTIIREFKIKDGRNRGRIMIKYSVEDLAGSQTELTIWPDQYEMAKKYLDVGKPFKAQCLVSEFNNVKSIVLKEFLKVQP